ncbi:hypothetical protein EPUL_002274 [Erysiphe pulchra]|uniref:P-loop containing nucleoside triphosphate hydrolase n=1 Tax=Erysiphe pulchra TaxID=225359 RepID=A0A2S4PZ29_9PEZI|nr:hypothetical protein EPUL_002274 [Erysiphe pulchra]
MTRDRETKLVTDSLENFQTDEQRSVLDTISNVRRCGLDGVLSLPQIVVCGDQSSGKSSVLEALTEIPFPRSDNLCTRYATEIILRRAENSSIMIKINPDEQRPAEEQENLKKFQETITDFSDLPEVMDMARDAMGIDEELTSNSGSNAFSRDVLSITMEGPEVPQLTLVDIPGLIANATLGISDADVQMVGEITNYYISQSRTICLAVISATNDYANQSIVTRIRKYDPLGDRTLGVITKPDRLEVGSANEKGFINLARNQDINYKLGWHIIKNRSHAEADDSLIQRNISESNWLRNSNFNVLGQENLGIGSLRKRLSKLLFEHVKLELPKLRQELESRLVGYKQELAAMGESRATASECRTFLISLSQGIREICKNAVDGHYQSDFFTQKSELIKCGRNVEVPITRVRAVVQCINTSFAEHFRIYGHKYQFSINQNGFLSDDEPQVPPSQSSIEAPIGMNKAATMAWINTAINNARGHELLGNFNPLLVGELFWEQSSKWKSLAEDHIENIFEKCTKFLRLLIQEMCPRDVASRIWDNFITEKLNHRNHKAMRELEEILGDFKRFPINYNSHYVENLQKKRQLRIQELQEKVEKREENHEGGEDNSDDHVKRFIFDTDTLNPEKFTCDEMFDSLVAIYKIQQEVFIANVTTQVIERHVVGDLEGILDPVAVNGMTNEELGAIALEPVSSLHTREHIQNRINRLEQGYRVLRGIAGK